MAFESNKKSVVSSVMWDDKYWLENIFDLPHYTVKRVHVDALFLSLAATKMLSIRRDGGRVIWTLAWLDSKTPSIFF